MCRETETRSTLACICGHRPFLPTSKRGIISRQEPAECSQPSWCLVFYKYWPGLVRVHTEWMISSAVLQRHQPVSSIRKFFPSPSSLCMRFICQVHLFITSCLTWLPMQVTTNRSSTQTGTSGAAFDSSFKNFLSNIGCNTQLVLITLRSWHCLLPNQDTTSAHQKS